MSFSHLFLRVSSNIYFSRGFAKYSPKDLDSYILALINFIILYLMYLKHAPYFTVVFAKCLQYAKCLRSEGNNDSGNWTSG